MSIRQVLDDDLANVVLPADKLLDRANDEIELPSDPRHQIAQSMELFRSRAAQSYLDILRTICQNRCRIRRTLCHTVADWDNLQLDAEEIDMAMRAYTKEEPVIDPSISSMPIYSFPLSSWTYFHKLRQMEWVVQIGFELEIYQPDELAGMYFYLQHLSQRRIAHLERIRGFVVRKFQLSGRATETSIQKDPDFGRTLSYLKFSMLEATANQGFADALSCLYTVLFRIGAIKEPPRPYSDDAKRYELRMKPFLGLSIPEFIPYATFEGLVKQPEISTEEVLVVAQEAVGRARKDFELLSRMDAATARYVGSEEGWKEGIKGCLKACIAASIVITMLWKTVRSGEKGTLKAVLPEPGKTYHDFWVVPKVLPA
jgi:hypothetical protein